MLKIGFKNFRKFENLNPIELNDISFLVGPNNSGKSTLVKALLLVKTYLASDNINSFSFDNQTLNDVNIVTYGRAKYNKAKENFISFKISLESFEIKIKITAEDDNATEADLLSLSIFDNESNFKFEFKKGLVVISKYKDLLNTKKVGLSDVSKKRVDNLLKLMEEYEESRSSREYLELVDQLKTEYERQKRTKSDTSYDSPENEMYELSDVNEDYGEENEDYYFSLACEYENQSIKHVFDTFLDEMDLAYDAEFSDKVQGEDQYGHNRAELRGYYHSKYELEKTMDRLTNLINNTYVGYIGANPSKQHGLYMIRNKENTLAQAIHHFYQSNILEGEMANSFVYNWMREFEIGTDYRINQLGGEAYTMEVLSNDEWVNISDKGMGSLQVLVLILRLAVITHHFKGLIKRKNQKIKSNADFNIWIVIEEPELNLHPALQSKISDLIYDIYRIHGVKFILETHSEYMIRKTQVIAIEQDLLGDLGDNPFGVIYYPKTLGAIPYKMMHTEDGTFDKDFGPGFLDEASSMTMKILRNKRKLRSND